MRFAPGDRVWTRIGDHWESAKYLSTYEDNAVVMLKVFFDDQNDSPGFCYVRDDDTLTSDEYAARTIML